MDLSSVQLLSITVPGETDGTNTAETRTQQGSKASQKVVHEKQRNINVASTPNKWHLKLFYMPRAICILITPFQISYL